MALQAEVPAPTTFAERDFLAGDWLIQPSLGIVSRGEGQFHLEPKTMLVLICLARHVGTTVSKDQLLREVWPDTFITEHVLTHAIWQLRRVFGRDDVIQTVSRRGYRLAVDVRPATGSIRSLAVLPIANLTGDPQQEYFADGMTESLISALAQIGALKVISRTTAMQYKSAVRPLPHVAAELKVDGIIEGSVTRSSDRVRISVQLIHGSTDQHLWARNYERDFKDLLALEEEIAREIASEIEITLTEKERKQLTRGRTVNPSAHEAYLKGRFCHARASESGLRMAISYMQQAISIDPEYALAYAGIADSIALLASPVAGAIAPSEANHIMRPAVERALQLDPDLPLGNFLDGWMKVYYDWDWAGAEAAFQRTLSLNPSYAMAYDGLGTVYEALGLHQQAISSWNRACELDPLSMLSKVLLGWTMVLANRASQAVGELRQTLQMDPNYWFGREVLALALLAENRLPEAISEAEVAVRLAPEPFPLGTLGTIYARSGRRNEAVRILNELQALSETRYVSPNLIAFVLAGLGDMDRAFDYVDAALKGRDASLIWLKSLPVLWGQPLLGYKRYSSAVSAMHLE